MDTQHIKHSKFGPFSAEGGVGVLADFTLEKKKA